jgi:hypothetical protein
VFETCALEAMRTQGFSEEQNESHTIPNLFHHPAWIICYGLSEFIN